MKTGGEPELTRAFPEVGSRGVETRLHGPSTIGRFRVERLLGEGGFARVYLAHDPSLDRQVAIKVPHADAVRSDFLRREALMAAKLKHPAIVQIHEICPNATTTPLPDDPPVYVVMQFVEGTTLAKRLESEKVSLDAAVDIMIDVAEAVGFAHTHGVLHRDLKPHNILLDADGRPYVADFGLAVRQETVVGHVGEYCGTPAYMSPEQAAGGSVAATSDVWSLGVILYELLVRQRPFGSHPVEIMNRLGKEDPRPPRDFDSAVPVDLDRVCLKCLARDPAERYQSAAELVADLKAWKGRREVGPVGDDLQKAEEYAKQAIALIAGGDLTSAVGRLRSAIQLNPDHAAAHYLLGLAQLMTDQNVRPAVESLHKAVELNRENAAANFVLANVYVEAKIYSLAAPLADQALATQPTNQTYRDFQMKVRDRVGSGTSVTPPPVTEADFDLPPERRRHLAELAEATFHLDRSRQLSLNHWVEWLAPWRWIRSHPVLGATIVALVLYAVTTLLYLPNWDGPDLVRLAVIYAVVWVLLWVPGVVSRVLETTYVRLLPAVNMPEDAFRRFFVRQSAYLLGGTCGMQVPVHGRWRLLWRYNRLHLLIAALYLVPFGIFQYFCAHHPVWPLTPALAAFWFGGVFEMVAVVLLGPMITLGSLFIPRFYNIPVRYFLGMPPELSLAPIGTFFVRGGWLACLTYTLGVIQHYVFQTYLTVPFISLAYMGLFVAWCVVILVVTQYQLSRLLRRLKARRVLEYSYHVEAAFEGVMKKPTEKGFADLRAHQDFMKELKRLNTVPLTGSDIIQLGLIVAIIVAVTLGYAYLVATGTWLVEW